MNREPTEQEIYRAMLAYNQNKAPNLKLWFTDDDVRRTLKAAMNPPAAPEIEITTLMVTAGLHAYCAASEGIANPTIKQIESVYRAMFAARPNDPIVDDALSIHCGLGPHFHGRQDDKTFGRKYQRTHRRKDDPP